MQLLIQKNIWWDGRSKSLGRLPSGGSLETERALDESPSGSLHQDGKGMQGSKAHIRYLIHCLSVPIRDLVGVVLLIEEYEANSPSLVGLRCKVASSCSQVGLAAQQWRSACMSCHNIGEGW